MDAFEKISHYSEPVVTVAIEAKHMEDLPKLIEVMRTVAKEDACIQVQINQETGENLLSGMGELHLEITQYRIVNDYKVEIKASTPIVVYRECVKGHGGPFEGKSPNKHNRFFFEVLPLEDAIVAAMKAGEIKTDGKIKDTKALAKQLSDLGMDKDQAKGIVSFKDNNVLFDMTKGIQNLNETMELCKQAFNEAMNRRSSRSREVRRREDAARRCQAARGLDPPGTGPGHPGHTGRPSTAPCAWESGCCWSR